MSFPLLLLRRRRRSLHHFFLRPPTLRPLSSLSPQTPPPPTPNPTTDPKSSLSARLSFVFDQIDAIDQRPHQQQKDQALQLIRQWRQSRHEKQLQELKSEENNNTVKINDEELLIKKRRKEVEVEVVHPWTEWIELMERLGHQNYFVDFHQRRAREEEERVAESVGIDLGEGVVDRVGGVVVEEEVGFDFTRDWMTVRNACMNFGKDRFDILRSLSRKDLQVLVGHGCPSTDPKVVFSAKLLRKLTHLDEGDVCSSCTLRNSCSRGYILTRKEDEARTLDVMRILLTFGFDHVNGAVENKALMQMKSVKTVVRKLLHEIVKLSAVPIDPNLPPPVIKKPPPKVKQPPPQPKKRVGRDDVEMKKGDWLCSKCDFMNFAKNSVCLQCDAKRPKRQLLPGEWECPQCNFLNYRRNMACFHCDAKRPPDEFTENQFQPMQSGPRTRLDRPARVQDVSNAWNFDFDDNESDGADVAAFEFANSSKMGDHSDIEGQPHGRASRGFEEDTRNTSRIPRTHEHPSERNSTRHSDRTGFDDFDDEEDDDDDDVDSYQLDDSNNTQSRGVPVTNFSEVENASDSENSSDFKHAKDYISGSEDDDEFADHPQLKSSHVAESWHKSRGGGKSLGSNDDIELGSDFDDSDDDMDEDFGIKPNKIRQQSSGMKGINIRRGRGSDLEDELLLDSDSDGGNGRLYSGRNSNKMSGNNFRKSNNFGPSRGGEFKSEDRDGNRRRDSFGGGKNDDFSSRASHRGGGYNGRRVNDRFHHRSDSLDDRRGNRRDSFGGDQNDDFSSSSRRVGFSGGRESNRFNHRSDRVDDRRENRRASFGSDRSDDFSSRGSHRDDSNGFGGRRESDRHQRFDELGGDDGRGRRSNQFSDRSRGGSKRNERGSHREGRSGWGKDDGFQRRKSSRFNN